MQRPSRLFEPGRIGGLEIVNRFVRSATFEAMAGEDGAVTDDLIRLYQELARGGIGLIITGHMYTLHTGRGHNRQIGIHMDEMIPGLKALVDAVHAQGGTILFQLSHAGRQTASRFTGQTPAGPSAMGLDPVYFERCREMHEEEIHEVVTSFREGALRAVEAGADGVQLLAAHGYLLNEFLSPYFNRRTDDWGGSDEKRFRLLGDVVQAVRAAVPPSFPVTIKLSGHDHTPGKGVTPALAGTYAGWLCDMGIDAIEVSAGSIVYSFMSSIRGRVPAGELAAAMPTWMRPFAWLVLKSMGLLWPYEQGYNVPVAKEVRTTTGGTPLILGGGFSDLSVMDETIGSGVADFIALARPLVRDPYFVRSVESGSVSTVSCVRCNRCFAAIAYDKPLRCYVGGIPRG